MAHLIACADGDLTTSTNWGVVDTTSLQVDASNSTLLTTSYVASTAFTPGAITIDGVAVKIAVKNGTTSGTLDFQLWNSTAGSQVVQVSINLSDLNASTASDANGGYIFFKFSPTLLVAATNYQVRMKTSAVSLVTLHRNATAGNWVRMLRTTTNQTPATGDVMHIMKEWTAAATGTARAIDMDSVAATDYGLGTADLEAFTINQGGSLKYKTAAATNYVLRLSGNMSVYTGGLFTMGESGAEIPRDSTAVLEFDPAADGDAGLSVKSGGRFDAYGLSRTSGKDISWCKLNADEAAAQTTISVDTDTGWLSGDNIVIAPTTRTSTQGELRILNANAAATTMDITVGLTNAHTGTGEFVAEIGLLTRNVRVRSTSSTIMAYVNFLGSCTVYNEWVEYYYLGDSVTNQGGVVSRLAGTGVVDFQYCSLHDFEDGGWDSSSTSSTATSNFQKGVMYNLNTASVSNSAVALATVNGGGVSAVQDSILIQCRGASQNFPAITISSDLNIFKNNAVAGCNHASGNNSTVSLRSTNGSSFILTSGQLDNNVIHSNVNSAMGLVASAFAGDGTIYGKIDNLKTYRNSNFGLFFGSFTGELHLDNFKCYGVGSAAIGLSSGFNLEQLMITNADIQSEASFTTPYLISATTESLPSSRIYFVDSDLGNTTNFSSGFVQFSTSTTSPALEIISNNCNVPSTITNVLGIQLVKNVAIRFHKKNGTLATAENYYKTGTIFPEGTVRHTASGISWKMTPSRQGFGLVLPGPSPVLNPFKTAVNGGSAVTVSAWVRKDGSYNGSFEPRLVIAGYIIDGVPKTIDSLSVGVNTWEQLQCVITPTDAGVLEYYIECCGTAGNVYVDNITVTQ